jgi:hypothetical protein
VHLAGCLAVDRWQGDPRVQLRIIDVASADPVGRVGGGVMFGGLNEPASAAVALRAHP